MFRTAFCQKTTSPDPHALPYSSFGPQLKSLLDFVSNRLARDTTSTIGHVPGADLLVESVSRISANAYRTAKFICSEDDAIGRQPEFVLSLPPLTRSLVDSLFLLVYLFSDIKKQLPLYMKGGWKELAEELARDKSLYGNDPNCDAWIKEYERGMEGMASEAKVTDFEKLNPTKVPYWPIPSQMLKDPALPMDRVDFLTFVNDWHYRELSSSTPVVARAR